MISSKRNADYLHLASTLIQEAAKLLGQPEGIGDADETALDVASGRLSDALNRIHLVLNRLQAAPAPASQKRAPTELEKLRALPRC